MQLRTSAFCSHPQPPQLRPIATYILGSRKFPFCSNAPAAMGRCCLSTFSEHQARSGGFVSWSQGTTSTHLKLPHPTEVLESNHLALWPPSHLSGPHPPGQKGLIPSSPLPMREHRCQSQLHRLVIGTALSTLKPSAPGVPPAQYKPVLWRQQLRGSFFPRGVQAAQQGLGHEGCR